MLTKDQAFSVNEFINRYSNESISDAGEEFASLIQDFPEVSGGHQEIHRFILKYGDRSVAQASDKIFDFFQRLTERLEVKI